MAVVQQLAQVVFSWREWNGKDLEGKITNNIYVERKAVAWSKKIP